MLVRDSELAASGFSEVKSSLVFRQWWALAALKLARANSAAKNALADALAPLISFSTSGDFSGASIFTF